MRVILEFFFFCFQRENEDAEKIVKRHIALLHRYNEAKDATQVREGGSIVDDPG